MPKGTYVYANLPTDLTDAQIEEKAREYISKMTLKQKVNQMGGDEPLPMLFTKWRFRGYNRTPIHAGTDKKLGIPGIRFTDGPRGVVMGNSTCFPVAIGRGASWDIDLEERVGDVIGVEGRTQGANLFAGVCINLLRHPAWGRAQESYGEDPYLMGEMGAALVRGVQRHIMACAKHYALNSMENSRFQVDVQVDERTLREVYLHHFKRTVEEGVASIMTAYNMVNGQWCGHNAHLIKDVLKGDWGFKGFTMTDFIWGMRDAVEAALGGQDLEMPGKWHYNKKLEKAVKEGKVPESVLDEAIHRLLTTCMRFARIGEPERYSMDVVASPAHVALAREAAQKSMVLLKNEALGERSLLPLKPEALKSMALLGELAAVKNIGDHGSSAVRPPYVITALEGFKAALPESVSLNAYTGKDIEKAVEAAKASDVAVVVAGYRANDEGEFIDPKADIDGGTKGIGGDRLSLSLWPDEEELILKVAEANPKTIVVLIGGSGIITENWRHKIPAILLAWYPGMEGGHAIADAILGKINPSGKLVVSFPISADDLAFYEINTKKITYDYLHGYWKLDHEGKPVAFPFGFGMSYTSYVYKKLKVADKSLKDGDNLEVSVKLSNTGAVAGDEVVQLYLGYKKSKLVRAPRAMKGFQRVHLEPGETKEVNFSVPVRALEYYDVNSQSWQLESGDCKVWVGASSATDDLLEGEFRIKG